MGGSYGEYCIANQSSVSCYGVQRWVEYHFEDRDRWSITSHVDLTSVFLSTLLSI
jgi:hypothetical protein